MIHVKINENELNIPSQGLNTLGELVEYVKSSIDPETIIVSLTKNDQPLSDLDWRNPLTSQVDMRLSFTTGSKSTFIKERFQLGADILSNFKDKIEICAQSFKQLRVHSANKEFGTFVSDLNAFVSWMHSIYLLDQEKYSDDISTYSNYVNQLEQICIALQNQQITSSWWALGDSLINKLLPLVKNIEELVNSSLRKLDY